MSEAQLEPLGDSALLIRFGDRVDATLNARSIGAAKYLANVGLSAVRDIAPAYASVCVRYDPLVWDYERLATKIRETLKSLPTQSSEPISMTIVEIPVCYGGEFGPDLEDVAQHAALQTNDVVDRHCANIYRVAMLGFAPGFPYLLGLDSALQMPRRANPRTRVPTGSVAIGGAQTGIYPRELPGGWHLIGRTPLGLFDASRDSPALLAPGMTVRFRPIDAATFAAMQR